MKEQGITAEFQLNLTEMKQCHILCCHIWKWRKSLALVFEGGILLRVEFSCYLPIVSPARNSVLVI